MSSLSARQARKYEIEMHGKRMRRIVLHGSLVAGAVGLGWGVFFLLRGNWPVVALDVCAVALCALDLHLIARERFREASFGLIVVLFALLWFSSAWIDIPTAAVPRSMHAFYLPLAAASCLLLRHERAWIRHGVPLLCLATFAWFACTNDVASSAYALPDSIRRVGVWLDTASAMASLYATLDAIQSDLAEVSGLEAELRDGLVKREMVLYYQPQISETGGVVGAEALVRWQHPSRGLVPPNDFIPLAETSGLMVPLGDWVLRTACAQLAAWQAQPVTAGIEMAVNVSASQFADPAFVERVREIVAASGAPVALLKLELTESMLAEDIDDMIAKMSELRGHGFRFSLDDFGTGFSSLSYLRKLPISQLKIDQAFVRRVLDSAADASIAQTVVTLGNSLNLEVIAEGVETIEHRSFLSQAGCRLYQGYFFSRPLPIAQFDSFVNDCVAAAAAVATTAAATARVDTRATCSTA